MQFKNNFLFFVRKKLKKLGYKFQLCYQRAKKIYMVQNILTHQSHGFVSISRMQCNIAYHIMQPIILYALYETCDIGDYNKM